MTDESPATKEATTGQYHFWWGFMLLVLGGLIGAGLMQVLGPARQGGGSEGETEAFPVLGSVSGFSLVERSGRTVSLEDLKGKVWVADFFFTSCASICPMMSSRLAALQNEIKDVEDTVFVSISVDPERDTPERLQRYAERYGADPGRWWFLTGDKQTIYRLSHESFHLSVQEIPKEEREAGMEPVLHSSKFVLLDRQGRIRGYYDGESAEVVERLAADIRRLLTL